MHDFLEVGNEFHKYEVTCFWVPWLFSYLILVKKVNSRLLKVN